MSKASVLLKSSVVIDTLFHSINIDPPPAEGDDIVDLILKGGVSGIIDSVISDTYSTTFHDLCTAIGEHWAIQDTFPSKFLIVEKFQDIAQAKNEGKLAFIMSTQGTDFLEGDSRKVRICHKLGIRAMQLTYNSNCSVGAGVYETVDNGLTNFGHLVVSEMNHHGLVIDLSHAGDRTSLDAIAASKDPVIFSHSGVRSMCNHRRNLSDEQIIAVIEKGGVIGLCPHCVMISNDHSRRPTVNDFIDSMLYVADKAGSTDNIAIGSDRWSRSSFISEVNRTMNSQFISGGFFGGYDANSKQVAGFNNYDEWENLVEHMLKREFSDQDIKKILGGNILRIFEEVWN